MINQISQELKLNAQQINAVVGLLSQGNTVPFIARYRKEVTGSLDEVQIRAIEERMTYLRELDARRKTILESIESQGKMTEALKSQILSCQSKQTLEDLYLPYKPKRRTRAMIAREKGLEPLALWMMSQPKTGVLAKEAEPYVSAEKGVENIQDAIAGARDIIAEHVAETAEIRSDIRQLFEKSAQLTATKREEVTEPTKFEQYYQFKEPISQIPSHRFLALQRAEKEDVLKVDFEMDSDACLSAIRQRVAHDSASVCASELELVYQDAYKRLIRPSLETDLRIQLKMKSDRDAILVFAENLKNLLLASPFGTKSVIGIDPGLRTGCKCAVVSETGKFLDNTTLFLSQGQDAQERSKSLFLALVQRYSPSAIAVGNGTAGRETEATVRKWLKESGNESLLVVSVSESGASVYSASEVARLEFPDLDLTIRGAISIARRLQDPLAELVKVEPKAMGVGQYQHDVFQPLLEKKLSEVVESCVNQVGVELNTASAPLLSYVAGIGPALAKNIVSFRDAHGPFQSRQELQQVAGLGPKTFEQAAGFLRIIGSKHPLDASAVHPERYAVVEHIAQDLGVLVSELVGNTALAQNINTAKYVSHNLGQETLNDIIAELKKPGRDPRSEFVRPAFREDVNQISDLKRGMVLEGVVTNVTAFGAFVDIGVHQDGLVHISELSTGFVKDPKDVVSAGQKLKVEVLDVDAVRKRISLSARIGKTKTPQPKPKEPLRPKQEKPSSRVTLGSLADFAKFRR